MANCCRLNHPLGSYLPLHLFQNDLNLFQFSTGIEKFYFNFKLFEEIIRYQIIFKQIRWLQYTLCCHLLYLKAYLPSKSHQSPLPRLIVFPLLIVYDLKVSLREGALIRGKRSVEGSAQSKEALSQGKRSLTNQQRK